MRQSLTATLAAYFLARPNAWIDGRELAIVAGFAGWRSRISDVRRAPFSMPIRNRQRFVKRPDGGYVVTEYMYVPATTATAPSLHSDGSVTLDRLF